MADGLTINMTNEQLHAVVALAITEAFSGEERDKMIQGAIESLFLKPSNGYGGKGMSPMADIFKRVASAECERVATELLESDPYKSQLREAVVRAIDLVVSDAVVNDAAKSVAFAMGDGMARTIENFRYRDE